MTTRKGVVNIRGKEYLTVAKRVADFREVFKPADGWAIRTWLISNEGDRVVVSASICDKDDHVVATGFAEEDRTQGNINKTSALENAETSAIGRCLAAFGLGGDEYCSADELVNALSKQAALAEEPPKPPEKPPEKDEPPKKKKFNPMESINKYLGLMEDLVGEDATGAAWQVVLKHSDYSHGAMSIRDVERLCSFTDKVAIKDSLKKEYLDAVSKTEKADQPTEEEPF